MFRILIGALLLVSAITGLAVQPIMGAVGVGFVMYGFYSLLREDEGEIG